MRDECVRGHALQTYFCFTLDADPHHPELSPIIAHAHIKDLTLANFPFNALDHEAANAHVGYKSRVSKGQAMGIHSPNLHRELDFNSWTLASIHADIVRWNCHAENLLGLPQTEYWSVNGMVCRFSNLEWADVTCFSRGQAKSTNRALEDFHNCRTRPVTRQD
jgi:hypothetical protein